MENVLKLAIERAEQLSTLSFIHSNDILADRSIKIVKNYLNELSNIVIAKDE